MVQNSKLNLGELGEELVACWLQGQGWEILYRRWRCRWGELDLIAHQSKEPCLIFVEVKTRRQRNWDADGLLAITPHKQAKIRQTAELFLADRPDLAILPCRFDVALVRSEGISSHSRQNYIDLDSFPLDRQFQLGQAVLMQGHQLILQDYLKGV